jgi:hypothetical protein
MFNTLYTTLGPVLFEQIIIESVCDYCVYEDKLEETIQLFENTTFESEFFSNLTPYFMKNLGIYKPELLEETVNQAFPAGRYGLDNVASTNVRTGQINAKSGPASKDVQNNNPRKAAPSTNVKENSDTAIPTINPTHESITENLFYFDAKDRVISGENKIIPIRITPEISTAKAGTTAVFLYEAIANGINHAIDILEEARCSKMSKAVKAAAIAGGLKKKV